MRRNTLVWTGILVLSALVSAGAGESWVSVVVVRLSSEAGEVRYRYQDLPAAVRFLSPVPFSARSGGVDMTADSSMGILERGRDVLAKRPLGTLEQVAVLLEEAPAKPPRPGRTMTIRFTLDELLAKGGAWSTVPAAWACYLAAVKSGWTSGAVWADSLKYDARSGRFTVLVGLSR